MLSGEDNAGERWKTTIGLISKKVTLLVQHTFFCTFLCRCFARLQRETSRNFLVTLLMEEMSYVFSFTFFHCRSFSPCIWLVAASISHFVTAATRFSCTLFFQHKMSPLFFISRSRSLSPFFTLSFPWPSAFFLFFSVFLLLYIPDLWTWQLI